MSADMKAAEAGNRSPDRSRKPEEAAGAVPVS